MRLRMAFIGFYFMHISGVIMIKGLAITPPIIGRISIGKVVEKNGKRLPEKDDSFTITTQVQNKDGWILSPIDELLRSKADNRKIRSIPVRLLFNDPQLNLRAEYSLFDRQTGRPICIGNGEVCRRYTDVGIESKPCPSPDKCELAKSGCKPYGRLNVQIGEADELGSYIFRTTGFNSIRTLSARLHYYQAISGNLLACLPLELRLRGKSTTQSYRSVIYYVDIVVREWLTLQEALTQARELDAQRKAIGFNQDALDAAAVTGFANGEFEDSEEEIAAVVEEFFPEDTNSINTALPPPSKTSLIDKLNGKAHRPG